MMYWHCIAGGYKEYIRSFIDYYYQLIPDFKENAKKIFGMNGIYVPAGTTPNYGLMNQVVPVIVNWIGAAGWISQHMYEYYLSTQDECLLVEKILPFMEYSALFYEEYLIEENGTFQIIPSVSPENTPANFQKGELRHMAHSNPTTKNATMDVAIIKELLTNLVSISKSKACNTKKILIWENIIKKLPAYAVNRHGAIKEWLSEELEDFYYHRHLSHVYPIFPGKEMFASELEGQKNAFRKAVELRVQGGQSGWSLAQLASVYARLGDGNKALECLEIIAKGCLTASFFTLHNDWREMGLTLDLLNSRVTDKSPVQLDAILGLVNAVQEMLFQYAEGIISVLPSLPEKWKRGNVQGYHFYDGSIDLFWNTVKNEYRFVIYSSRKQTLKIRFPKSLINQKIFICYENGRSEQIDSTELKLDLDENEKISIHHL